MKTALCTGCGILAGRVRTNCHSTCPAHAAFGGYKPFGMVRANHKMMLDRRSQTKNLLVSHWGRSSDTADALARLPAVLCCEYFCGPPADHPLSASGFCSSADTSGSCPWFS